MHSRSLCTSKKATRDRCHGGVHKIFLVDPSRFWCSEDLFGGGVTVSITILCNLRLVPPYLVSIEQELETFCCILICYNQKRSAEELGQFWLSILTRGHLRLFVKVRPYLEQC